MSIVDFFRGKDIRKLKKKIQLRTKYNKLVEETNDLLREQDEIESC